MRWDRIPRSTERMAYSCWIGLCALDSEISRKITNTVLSFNQKLSCSSNLVINSLARLILWNVTWFLISFVFLTFSFIWLCNIAFLFLFVHCVLYHCLTAIAMYVYTATLMANKNWYIRQRYCNNKKWRFYWINPYVPILPNSVFPRLRTRPYFGLEKRRKTRKFSIDVLKIFFRGHSLPTHILAIGSGAPRQTHPTLGSRAAHLPRFDRKFRWHDRVVARVQVETRQWSYSSLFPFPFHIPHLLSVSHFSLTVSFSLYSHIFLSSRLFPGAQPTP